MAVPPTCPTPLRSRTSRPQRVLRRARPGSACAAATPAHPIYSPSSRGAIRRRREHRPDIAHLHNVYHQLTLSIVDELTSQRVPTVMTLHDYKMVCPAYTLFTEGALPALRRLAPVPRGATSLHQRLGARERAGRHRNGRGARPAVTSIYALISPSRFLAELAARRVPSERVHVLPNFLPVEELPAPVPAAERDPAMLFAGRLEEVKGLRPLLGAFVHGDTGGVRLVIAGDGPMRAEVEAAAGRTAAIDYAGPLTRG